jgi:hypothetical protein
VSALTHLADSEVRRLAKVLRHVLDRETFETMSDLKAAFADALGRHRIFYEPWDMDAAFAFVSRDRPLLVQPPRLPTEPLAPDPPPIPRRDAQALLQAIQQRLGPIGLKPIPSVTGIESNPTLHEHNVRRQADAMRARSEPLPHATRSRFSANKFSKRG